MKKFLLLPILLYAGCALIQPNNFPEQPLKDSSSKSIGVAVDSNELFQNKIYQEVVLKEFISITPENAFKMENLEPQKEQYQFSEADKLIQFAKDKNLRFRAHPLIWHRQIPTWLEDLSDKEVKNVFRKYIRTVVKNFKGKIHSWDVVNEAFLRDGKYRPSIWYNVFGPSYIEEAFRITHQEDPKAFLFYNDYEIEKAGPKFEAVYKALKKLKEKGVPIYGVGLQAHLSTLHAVNENELDEVIKKFAGLGLKVEISELDVGIPHIDTPTNLMVQQNQYRTVGKVCTQNPTCTGITLWGLDDGHSWIPKEIPTLGKATLFDEKYSPKVTYEVFKKSLAVD